MHHFCVTGHLYIIENVEVYNYDKYMYSFFIWVRLHENILKFLLRLGQKPQGVYH